MKPSLNSDHKSDQNTLIEQNPSPREQPDWLTLVYQLAEPIALRESCFIYDIEMVGQGSGKILRVYIDTENGRVDIEQCALVSRGLNLLLDVEDIIPGGSYSLEVSSPGLERPLRKPWHFVKARGQTIILKLFKSLKSLGLQEDSSPWAATQQMQGLLKDVLPNEQQDPDKMMQDPDKIIIEGNMGTIEIPFSAIKKANVVFEFEVPQKPKNSKGSKLKKKKTKSK